LEGHLNIVKAVLI